VNGALQPAVLAAVALAGALGAVARYAGTVALLAAWPQAPMPSLAVNVLGCFGFGVCVALGYGRWSPLASAAVLAGFFGGFTTFSSFAAECHALAADRRWTALALEIGAQNVLGLLALAAGVGAGGRLRRG
jgi:CrcB protein